MAGICFTGLSSRQTDAFYRCNTVEEEKEKEKEGRRGKKRERERRIGERGGGGAMMVVVKSPGFVARFNVSHRL